MAAAVKPVDVVRVRDGRREPAVDRAAAEEPLEVRLHGEPFAVIMRTPGADRELAAGFLFAERVINGADDLGTIEHCRAPVRAAPVEGGVAAFHPGADASNTEYAANVVNVTLVEEVRDAAVRALAQRRQVATTSSCGLCGRLTIESLASVVARVPPGASVAAAVITTLPDRLRAVQRVFDETGGLHAAGLFTLQGDLVASAEDVGRHNAVDKVIGRMLMADALPLGDRMLAVSGRSSYEIVQKALLAGIPVVASVSAPSTLAIELAQEMGITLVGFVRGATFNVYAHPERLV